MIENTYELLYMIRSGSEAALRELIKMYEPTIHMLVSISAQRQEYYAFYHEELYDEGVIALEQAVYTYREDKAASFNTYAIVLIKRRMWNLLRAHTCESDAYDPHKLAYFSDMENGISSIESSVFCRDVQSDPSYQYRYSEAARRVDKVMKEMKPAEQMIYAQLLEGRSRKAIIEKLGCTSKAFDGRLRKIRDKVRKAVYGEGKISA